MGMGAGQIPWSSIERYAVREEMDEDELERFEYIIRQMDDAWLQHHFPPKSAS